MRIAAVTVAAVSAVMSLGGCDALMRPNPRYCDGVSRRCADPAFPYCNLSTSSCLSTIPDGGMGAGAPCHGHGDCPEVAPICGANGFCTLCAGAPDNAACAAHMQGKALCQTTGENAGRCVGCLASTDCPTLAAPICGSDGVCRGCSEHAECPSKVCGETGYCAIAANIAWVDNRGRLPKDCAAAGNGDGNSAATAYCTIAAAMSEVARRPYIVIAGSSLPYDALSVIDRTVSLIGPGRAPGSRASIAGNGSAPGIFVGGQTALTVDGLEVSGGSPGINCMSAALTVRRSSIVGNTVAGLRSIDCRLTLDANSIYGNESGIAVLGGKYTITNNMIGGNSPSAPGVSLGDTASGVFSFNTVVANAHNGDVGGIDCGAGQPKTIENSIVFKNSTVAASQFGTNCVLSMVVTGSDARAGGIMKEAAFVDESSHNYLLKPGDTTNRACCVDKVPASSAPVTNHDVNGTPRPLGAGWDIGAHEVE